MLKRDYQAPEFRVQDTRTIGAQNVAQSDNRSSIGQSFGDETWRERMLTGLTGKGAQLLDKMADIEFGNLYLEGQAKAGQIESEAEIEGNPLTRDWQVAGYRDTMGKLSLADMQAQFSVDIKQLREKGPEHMQEYLNKRRAAIMPGLSGMTAEARASAMGQLLLQDRAAIQSHTTEHAAFILDEKRKGVASQMHTALGTLGNAQARYRLQDIPPAEFQKQLELTAGTLYGTIWADNTLTDAVKENFTFEAIQSTLANDSVELYDYIAQTEVPDGKGGTSTLMSRLDPKQQQQLANGYREAKSRTNGARHFYEMAQIENIEQQIKANKYMGGYDELEDMLAQKVSQGVIKEERAMSILGSYTKEQYELDKSDSLFQLAMSGDTHGAWLQGADATDMVDAIDKYGARAKWKPEQVMSAYLTAGSNGTTGAFEAAGKRMSSSLQRMRDPKGGVLPQHETMFLEVSGAIDRARLKGDAHAETRLLSGLAPEDAMLVRRIRAKTTQADMSFPDAVAWAVDQEAKEKAMPSSVRAAMTRDTADLVNSAIQAVEPMNILEAAWAWTKGFVSDEAEFQYRTRVESDFGLNTGVFSENTKVLGLYTHTLKEDMGVTSARVMDASPLAGPDEIMKATLADVRGRTVQTRHGPLIIPFGVPQTTAFGVSEDNLTLVAPAIDKMLKETKAAGKWHVSYVEGKIKAQEVDVDGNPIGNGDVLTPKEIAASVEALSNERQTKSGAVYGAGRKVEGNGMTLKYNGKSSADVPGEWMLEFRDNLVQSEGASATPYDDLSGKKDKSGKVVKTVGVGLSSHNPHYPKARPDGTIDPADIRKGFMAASNDAALKARKVQEAAGLPKTKATFTLLAEIAYQGGVNFDTAKDKSGELTKGAVASQQFLQALKSKDPEAAKAAFKRTPVWYYSVDPKKRDTPAGREELTSRRKHYLNLIEKSLQGA